MRTLYHFPLQPQSRKLRLLLKEKHLDCDLVMEQPWERREAFLRLNPACETPVLTEDSGLTLSGDYVITEYLEESYEAGHAGPRQGRARRGASPDRLVRRQVPARVTQHLLEEKVTKRLFGRGGPDSNALRAGKANIHVHLHYISWLIDRRNWLAGEEISADLAAAAPVVPRLSRRRAVGRASCRQGMVRAAQVPPQLPATAGRPLARHRIRRRITRTWILETRHSPTLIRHGKAWPCHPQLRWGRPCRGKQSRGSRPSLAMTVCRRMTECRKAAAWKGAPHSPLISSFAMFFCASLAMSVPGITWMHGQPVGARASTSPLARRR